MRRSPFLINTGKESECFDEWERIAVNLKKKEPPRLEALSSSLEALQIK
jgi:hypothetical protein